MHFLLITQVYPPDAAAVGQYFENIALCFVRRGHKVTVLTADRDYDNPSVRYDESSRDPRIIVKRLPWTSLGKRTLFHRLIGQVSYLCQCFVRMLFSRRFDAVVITTIPATTGIMFLILDIIRKYPFLYWVMDINPDQAVALGVCHKDSVPARFLRWANAHLVQTAKSVVCLDEDMKSRLLGASSLKRDSFQNAVSCGHHNGQQIKVIPPWPLEGDLKIIENESNPLISEWCLQDRVLFMYSGNHSLVHPLDTLIEVVPEMLKKFNIAFAFIGGGKGKIAVEKLRNKLLTEKACDDMTSRLIVLPYQPLDRIKCSLSAADVHIVSMGNEMVGIVHPCKIYNAMLLAKPILFLGPLNSAMGRIIIRFGCGWQVDHGDADGMIRAIEAIMRISSEELRIIGERGRKAVIDHYSTEELSSDLVTIAETLASEGE